MGILIFWRKSDVKIFMGVMIALVISVLMIIPPNQWLFLLDYFLETPPLLIFGQLGILILCSVSLSIVIIFIWRVLK